MDLGWGVIAYKATQTRDDHTIITIQQGTDVLLHIHLAKVRKKGFVQLPFFCFAGRASTAMI
jgi:hypothetical protein